MTDPGTEAARPSSPPDVLVPPGEDLPPPPPSGRSGRRVGLAIGAVVAIVAAGVAGYAVFGGDDAPSEWDPRIADLVRYVEKERGLEFDHPVPVEFLSDEEFRDQVLAEQEPTDEERAEIEQTEAVLRALGLIDADVDLLAEYEQVSGEGILGLYIPEEERVKVRGTELTPPVRVTLVHELTHVLQDQNFDIDAEVLESDTGESSGLRAALEGDAEQVARMYAFEELDSDELDELIEYQSTESDEAYSDVPDVLVAVVAAPYQLGYSFFELIMAVDGEDARNDALEDPPTSEEHLIDPWTYLDDDDPIDVDTPALADGEKAAFDDATPHFGSLSWYSVLAQRIDARVALDAVDGWGGDAYIAFERGDQVCVRARFAGDDEKETDQMALALDAWVAGGPPGASKVTRQAGYVELESCDQGDATRVPEGPDVSILVLPELRAELGAAIVELGVDDDVARCAANDLVHLYPLSTYADLSSTPFSGAGVRALVSDAVDKCG